MFEDEEERKKREEEARAIISGSSIGDSINSINYANLSGINIETQNEQEHNFVNKVNEANDIINSINPRQNVAAPSFESEEDRIKSQQNVQRLIDLMDNNTNSTTQISQQEDEDIATQKQREAVDLIMNKKSVDEIKDNTIIPKQEEKKEGNILTDIKGFFENLFLGGSSGVKQTLKYVETANEQNFDNYNNVREQQFLTSQNVSEENKASQKEANNLLLHSNANQRIQLANQNVSNNGTLTNSPNSTQQETNLVKKTLQDSIDQDTLKSQENIANASNPISAKLLELAPSMGQMSVGWAASAINPMLGISYFTTSAGGSYIDDAKERGMNEEESFEYGTIMGAMEGITEQIGISKLMKGGKALSKGAIKEALKNYGLNAADNFIQEAIIEPISEATATIVGGKDSANWDDITSRMLEAGIDGALSALIMDGVSAGINSSIRIVDKIRNNEDISQKEVRTAIQDISNNENIDVENTIRNEMNYQIQDKSNTNSYMLTRYNNENDNLEIYDVKGEDIKINNDKLNIAPAVVKIDGFYNVIDANTGLELYTTTNTTKQDTINEFMDRISNLDNAGIQNINNQVTKTKLALINKMQEVEINPNALQDFQVHQNQNNVSTNNSNTSIQNKNEQNINPKVRDLRTAINQIQNNSYYNSKNTSEILKTMANNFENITYTERGKSSTLTIKNEKGNTMYSKEIRNNIGYSGKSIKNILSNVYNYVMNDTSNTNNTKTSSEQNTNVSNSKSTNYAVQDIQKVTKPFNKQESYSRDELAETWNNEISQNNYDAYYDKNGNIERYIAIEEEGNNIVINQYDNNDNIVRSAAIPSENGRYNSDDIRDTILRISSNIDLSSYIQEMATNFQDDLANTLPGERYKAGDDWTGQKRSTTKELAEIKDETGASWNKIGEVLDDIANGRNNNTKLARTIEEKLDKALSEGYTNIYGKIVNSNEEYLNQKSKVYGRDFNAQTRENYDPTENMSDEDFRIFGMKKQNKKSNIEGNKVKSLKKKANNTTLSDEEIRNIVKYNPDGREIQDTDYVDFMMERFKDRNNISDVETTTTEVNTLLNETLEEAKNKVGTSEANKIRNKQKELMIGKLYSRIKNKKFKIIKKLKSENGNIETKELDIEISKNGLKESFNKSISNEKYAVVPFLDKLIQTSNSGTIRNETKLRQNIDEWYYLYNTAIVDNQLYGVKIDIKKTGQGDRFYVHRLNIIKEGTSNSESIFRDDTIRNNKIPSSTNSIAQKSQTVKNKTKQKTNKNQSNKTIKSLEDIKTKYKNQTDQLNIFENKDNTISINNLVVKQNLRNKGIGQRVLNDIIDYADKKGKTITLTPTSEYMTKNRLTNWYKKNGFVENKGRNTNYSISDTMYRLPKNSTNNNIRSMKQNTNKVTDSEGRTLTRQQQEYFKDSKVRDKNGNLLVMYHGTEANVGIPEDFWFTIFDIDKAGKHGSMLGDGFYFTSDKNHAEQYAHTKGHIYETYLNIKNPLELNHFSTGDLTYAIRNINPYIEADIYKRDGTIDGYKVRRYLLDNGYDGIHSGNTYVAFNSNQIKNITNSSPTSNDDIRYMKKSNSRNRTNKTNNSKNLIAQHNTSEEKLMEALDLGALPVPSIAIPISNYGDITLLFNKDTINPTDRRNVAYNSDIYSTRRPLTVNSLDKNKVKTFEKSMNDKGISYGYISQIEEYIQDNDFTRAKDTIRYELQKANPDITEQEIEDSFTEAIETIKDKRILREDVDPYTPSGNRRTIEQMSVPYTLDNIVRLMTKKTNKGSENNNFAGLAEVRANLSQQFKNVEEIHQQEGNLVSTEEMQKVKEQLNDEFYNLIDEIGKYDKVERYFGSTDTVANALNETAKAKNISKEVLENELDFVSITNVPDKVLQKAVDFLNSLKNVPTEYFEVKPQRAVGLNEIQSAIVPKNTSKELIDKLKENNIPITFYDTEQERSKLIANETENKNIRFAKKSAKTPKVEGEILEPGQTNSQRESNYIEQEIRKIEQTGNWDDSIPVTKMTDIRKTIENYLGLGIQKGHFRQQAYGIYKGNRDVIRTKELKDIDTILHETGHALDIGNRIKLDKESISNELLKAVENYGGYEAETREVQLEEGFAEVIREYTIIPEQSRIDYPQTVSVIEGIRQIDKDFNKFITDVQQQTYNYIHQNPENRVLSNQSIGERTDQTKLTPAKIQQEVMRNIYDKDWALKSAVNEMQKINGKTTKDLKASENAYYLTRLASGIGDKIVSMLSKGYIDENGNKLMPGLENLGEILGNNEQRFNDLRAYLVAQRDLEYKAKTLKTGIRTMDSKAVVEQFKNDTQIQEASKLVYDTLDGVIQYAVNNGLIDQETADGLRESNTFYVPMQRVLESNKNNVGRRGAVADIIKARTGSELDVKDVLENIVANSANIIQQVENNNILKALYNQGEQAGMTGKIYDVIDAPMVKIGTAKLSTWEAELKKQGVDTRNLDLEKTIDLFAPNNKVDANNLITSFINTNGKRVYLQFNDKVLFNSLMNMDKKFMSAVLNINRKLNMPLRYGATMANIGFAIPNMISDTAQAAIFSEAGFIPVVDNVIGIMDILSVQNKTARNFFNKIMPGYADRINTLYAIYEQTGSTSATRLSQYREQTQNIMKDVYGTKNSEVLGIQEKFKPLKRLLDIMTYIPEISEQSTRFRVFEKNLEYYRKNGMAETDARIQAALQSRDATQDFGRTGNITREINQLIPFSAARIGSAYTFAEKVKGNPKRVASRMAVLMTISMAIKAIGYDDDEIEELNQRKKNDNFVMKIGDQIITIKKPQGILRSIVNLGEYVQDLFTGHIEEGKEGERLAELVQSAIMDNMPADSVTGLVPNMVAPVVENAINKDFYYNSDIVKSYDLELPDNEQYYDYNSQLAIWLGQIFNYSPAKIDNLISGYFAGLGTSVTNVIDWIAGKTGITSEQPEMGAEDNAVGKRFFVNVNSNSASVDEIYDLRTELKKKENGGTITSEEQEQLDKIEEATSEMAKLNKQIKEIKKDLTKSGKEKAEEIKELQRQKTDTARQALGKDLLYSENESKIESTKFYPSRDTLSKNNRTLTMDSEMKKEYEQIASEYYNRYASQGLYSQEKLEQIESKAKDYAKNEMMKKYKSELSK